jgi:hypothetical protein
MSTTEGLQLIGTRPARIGLALALALGALAFAQAGKAQASTTCRWAGTPTAPSGWFTLVPGLTGMPSSAPSRFVAWGELSGTDSRCSGQMKWIGQADAGSTCAVVSFEGEVKGLQGVASFWGKGNVLVPSYLYDRAGNLVGIENANIMTEHNLPLATSCTEPGGFTGPADFSSTVVLF